MATPVAIPKPRPKRKAYDVSFKLRVVNCAECKTKEAAAREFKIDSKMIRRWCSQKEELQSLKTKGKSKSKRLKGAGRKPMDEDMEAELFEWIVDLRRCHLHVSRRMIREKAKTLGTDDGFRASKAWLQLFMKRNSLSLRRKTTLCQKTSADVIPKLVSFIIHLRKLQMLRKYSASSTFAMDETACWLDMPSDTTVDVTGANCVSLKTTGHDKDHFTVILTARADGTKLKPYIVFKGKGTRLIKDLQKIQGVVVRFSQNGWINDQLTIDYLHSIVGSLSFNKRMLVWDAYRCHTSEAVRREVTRMRLDTAIIPGGCTKYIQAPDVVWNSIFKAYLRNCYEHTKAGNLKPPSRSLLCDWIKSAWASFSDDAIRKSFLCCAISTNTNGSDDDQIHCFKTGQPCEGGRSVLQEAMTKLCDIAHDSDPFSDEIDEEETEENEACIDESDENGDGTSSDEED